MIVVILLVIIGVIVLMISYLSYRKVFHEGNNRQKDTYTIPNGDQYHKERERMLSLIKETDSIPYERVYTEAVDGIQLSGKYYHVKDGAPLHIQMHGYRSNGVRDFCGGNKIARESGHNTLIVEHRAHGESGGHTITFGVKERYDCQCWVNYAVERFGEEIPIFISGLSMGASTVLLAATLDLPSNVVGVIADCPYSSAEGIICKVCGDMKIPAKTAFPIVRLGGRLFGRFDVREADVVSAVAQAKVPILIIHGEADYFVPCKMSEALYGANKEMVTLEIFPCAGHGISYIVDTERYTRVVKKFIDGCLSSVI